MMQKFVLVRAPPNGKKMKCLERMLFIGLGISIIGYAFWLYNALGWWIKK